jgi:Fe-S-cluster formation regulator IscX/YfhJ
MDKAEGIAVVRRQCDEIIQGIGCGALYAHDVRRALQDIIDASTEVQPNVEPAAARFTPPHQQVANLRHWNDKYELNWSDRQLSMLLEDAPSYSKDAPSFP